jgi:hypothetical protein
METDMETSSEPTRPINTTARMGKVSKELPNDYALYVVECNNKLKATGEKSCSALPEHLWRASIKPAVVP